MEPRRPIIKDDKFYQRVLDRCSQSLIVDLDPTPLLDTFLAEEILEYPTFRDIQELPLTSAKNREILRIFRGRGHLGYNQLKHCLQKAEQRHLVDSLLKAESELERITEMEQRQMSERKEMSGRELSQRIPNEGELMEIAGFIGMNWEFLGHSLGVPTSQIDHFKMNIPGNVKMQIYRMLLQWTQSSVSPATMGRLIEILKSARSYVNMEWEKIEGIANSPARENRKNNQQRQGDLPSSMGNPRKEGLAPTKRENDTSSVSSTAHYPVQYPVTSHDQQLTQYQSDETGARPPSTSLTGAHPPSTSSQESLYPFANTRATGENYSNPHQADLSGISNLPDGAVNSVRARPDGDNVDADREQSYELKMNSRKPAEHTSGNFDPRQQPLSETSLNHQDNNQRTQSNQAVSPAHAIGQMEEGLNSLKLYFTGTNTPSASTVNTPSASTAPMAGSTAQAQPGQPVTAVLPEDNTDSSHTSLKPEIKKRVVKELSQLPYDGRLLTYSIETFQYIVDESRGTLKGGFGTVYIHSNKLEGLGIPVVVKVIEYKETEKRREKMMSVTNEKLASRTMHFSIVPLLAMTEDTSNSKFYFLTPYLENGDLREAIKKDTDTLKAQVGDLTAVELTSRRRLKIIYQIHAALNFLHTPVPGFRGTIVHMDLKSMNIVLDKYYNARLIDFGLAREMNETDKSLGVTESEVPGTIGYRPTTVYSRLTVKDDLHNFGIVIRELLTGKPAYDDETQKQLRKDDAEAVFDEIQRIWYEKLEDPSKEASKLNEIAADCISKRIDPSQLKNDIENLLGPQTDAKWERSEGDDKCEMCMINKKASIPDSLFVHNNNCTSNISVCVACMRNSFLNPIICHTCAKMITPIIGYGWGALLLAGNDVRNPELAEGFIQDISKVFEVFISKCPHVMGIDERNVQVVKPSKPGCHEKLFDKLDTAVETLIKGKIRTLLIYFSGHFFPEKGFLLGDDDEFLPVEALQNKMETIAASYKPEVESSTSISDMRFLIFLDCCAGPKLSSETDVKEKIDGDENMEVDDNPNIVGKEQSCESMPKPKLPELKLKEKKQCIIQLNACRYFQVTPGSAKGSAFTEFFVQALTQRALGTICRHGQNCRNCEIHGDFISIHDLHNYIYKHMLEERKQVHPVRYEHEVLPFDSVIANNVAFDVQLKFRLKNTGNKEAVSSLMSVPLKMYSKIQYLKSHLFRTLMEMMHRGKPEFHIDHYMPFVESICIEIDKGPKVTEELDTIPKIMAAWNARRDLAVSLRTDDNIDRGMIFKVMSAVPTVGSCVISNVQVVHEILTSLSSDKIKSVDSLLYKSVILPVSDLSNRIRDLRHASGSSAELKKCLVSVRSCITSKNVKTDDRSELHIIFSKPLKDFICFELKHLKKVTDEVKT